VSKLPVVSGKETVKALAKIGQKHSPFRRVTIPNHKEIAKGTLRSIIREVGLTIDEFADLLK